MATELSGSRGRNNGSPSLRPLLPRYSPAGRVSSRIGRTPKPTKPTRQLEESMRNRQRILSLIVAVTIAVTTGTHLYADDTNAAPASTMDQRIDALEREIQDLKRQRELDQEAAQQAAEKAKSAPIITAGQNGLGPDGFKLQSADSNYVLRVGGYAQADGRFYLNDRANNGTDTFLLRRVRPILEGTLYRDFDFRIMTDFGNGAPQTSLLQDAYVEWHHWQWLKLRVGKYKPPTGLEWLESDTDPIRKTHG